MKETKQARTWALAEEGKKLPEIAQIMNTTRYNARGHLMNEMVKRGLKTLPFNIYSNIGGIK